jgi:predicted ester cyclase
VAARQFPDLMMEVEAIVAEGALVASECGPEVRIWVD